MINVYNNTNNSSTHLKPSIFIDSKKILVQIQQNSLPQQNNNFQQNSQSILNTKSSLITPQLTLLQSQIINKSLENEWSSNTSTINYIISTPSTYKTISKAMPNLQIKNRNINRRRHNNYWRSGGLAPDCPITINSINNYNTSSNNDDCRLPNCFCSRTGLDIPGNLPITEVPQIILLTFNGAITDLNIALYKALFNGRYRNPNGCPITSTFFISHPFNNYDQSQWLASAGHELAIESFT